VKGETGNELPAAQAIRRVATPCRRWRWWSCSTPSAWRAQILDATFFRPSSP